MGAWSFPHPCISASSVLRLIQYSAKDVLTVVMPHTAKYGINLSISIHMKENTVHTRSRIQNIQYLEDV